MKKNTMMRLASALLVLVLLTTCAISGTFAKYVTSADAEDSARVAKFGVVLTVTNDDKLFSDTYESENGVTVQSKVPDDLVAPGTSSEEIEANTTFAITGTPEVAVSVSALIDEDTAKDVFLKAGTYKDWTTEDADDTFVLNDDYYPVKWTLTQTAETEQVIVNGGKLSDVIAALKNYTQSAEYAPNTELDSTFTLAWEWEFGDSANNKVDTLLGQIAAGVETEVDADNYSLNIAYKFDVTVAQID